MHKPLLTLMLAAPFLILLSSPAKAFECPQHFEAAQAVIDKVTADMKGMEDMMDQRDLALVHALLDDAKALLEAGRHNHEKPQGAYDHGRAIAKADGAKGYATAADILHFHYMENQ